LELSLANNGLNVMVSGTQERWFYSALMVLGAGLIFFAGSRLGSSASAEGTAQAVTEDGIMVVGVQLDRDSYGLAMVDTVGQTLWIYEINKHGPSHNRLKLLAARSWRYDRLLKQYNTAEPKPEQVRLLLEGLGEAPKEPEGRKLPGQGPADLETAEGGNK
jgi:hypothetical protein